MPAAALSAREVVRRMVGGDDVVVGEGKGRLPREFLVSEERVVEARGLPHLTLTQGWEATNYITLMGGEKGP